MQNHSSTPPNQDSADCCDSYELLLHLNKVSEPSTAKYFSQKKSWEEKSYIFDW